MLFIMRIAVLYICTGRYNQFFKSFYDSSEKYFLKDVATKEYFVFTDDMALSDKENVHLHFKKCEGFPKDSLFRFDLFLSVKDEIATFDYAYFFNANMLFVSPVGEEFLPKHSDFAAVKHPGYFKRYSWVFPYERRKESLAYIAPYHGPYTYYMGSLNGGKSDAFIKFATICSQRVHDDYNRGIVAIFHDESHLNAYMREISGEGIPPQYAYPEGSHIEGKPLIIIRNKVKVDKYFSKGHSFSLSEKLFRAADVYWRALRWYLKF